MGLNGKILNLGKTTVAAVKPSGGKFKKVSSFLKKYKKGFMVGGGLAGLAGLGGGLAFTVLKTRKNMKKEEELGNKFIKTPYGKKLFKAYNKAENELFKTGSNKSGNKFDRVSAKYSVAMHSYRKKYAK